MKARPFLLLCATGLLAIFSSTISKSPVLPLFAAHLGAGPSVVGAACIGSFSLFRSFIPLLFRAGIARNENIAATRP